MKVLPAEKRSRTIPDTRSTSHPLTSASIIANNDDLLIQILSPLPNKSLIKFKCVSKHWLSLISSLHLYRCSGLFLHTPPSDKPNFKFEFVSLQDKDGFAPPSFDPSRFFILHSCNGLLLCQKMFTGSYYIHNPTTNQMARLPRLKNSPTVFGMCLAFDPSKSPHYKVVCVRDIYLETRDYYRIEIYSSETSSWRVSRNRKRFRANDSINFRCGVYWNGAIHCITTWGDSVSLCFNVDQERLFKMPMPQFPLGLTHSRAVLYFGASHDHLHLVEIYSPPATQFKVLEMERDYSGWLVKYNVDINVVTVKYPEMIRSSRNPLEDLDYCAFSILFLQGVTKDESCLVLHLPQPGKVISFNLNDQTCNELCHVTPDPAPPRRGRRNRYQNDFEVAAYNKRSLKIKWTDAHQYIPSGSSVWQKIFSRFNFSI